MNLQNSTPSIPSRRTLASLVLVALLVSGTTGFTACATDSGVWTGPALELIPGEVLLRSSGAAPAVGLARLEGGDPDDRYTPTTEYANSAFVGWLTVTMGDRDLTLTAARGTLDPGVYAATVTVTGQNGGGRASLQVEFTVLE